MDFVILEDNHKFGLSLLHFGTNSVKAILKVAAQVDFRQHRCSGETNQYLRDQRKKKNAKILKDKFSIFVKDYFTVDGNITLKRKIMYYCSNLLFSNRN